uniref:SEA domain-containing protein n=1 Tax=Steinernema glaseri TaxID=37863 RepID=A0A1I8AFB4_9BILA
MIVVAQQKDDRVVTTVADPDDDFDQLDGSPSVCGAPRIAVFLTVFIVVLLGCSILFVAVYVIHMLIASASSGSVHTEPTITRFNERSTLVIQKTRELMRSSSIIEILQSDTSRFRDKKITIFPKFYRVDLS